MRRLEIFIIVLFLLFACNKSEECAIPLALRDCFTTDAVVLLSIRLEGENVFDNDIYQLTDVTITGDSAENFEISLQENSESTEGSPLVLRNSEIDQGAFLNTINIGDKNFTMSTVFEELPGGVCCPSTTRVNSLEINSESPSRTENNGHYIVELD